MLTSRSSGFCHLASSDYQFTIFLWSTMDCSHWLLLQNWRISWQNGNRLSSESQKHTILSEKTDRIRASVLNIWSHSFHFVSAHLIISASHAQFQSSTWFHCALWSALGLPRISSFTLSLYAFCPRHKSRRRSLFMRVLSHSDTHYLDRHMVECGCHEILTQRCITVPFLSDFSLHPIQLWFLWLSYSNHSFQLISIQYSVRQSSCKKPFISASN